MTDLTLTWCLYGQSKYHRREFCELCMVKTDGVGHILPACLVLCQHPDLWTWSALQLRSLSAQNWWVWLIWKMKTVILSYNNETNWIASWERYYAVYLNMPHALVQNCQISRCDPSPINNSCLLEPFLQIVKRDMFSIHARTKLAEHMELFMQWVNLKLSQPSSSVTNSLQCMQLNGLLSEILKHTVLSRFTAQLF